MSENKDKETIANLKKEVKKWKSMTDRYANAVYIDKSLIPWTIRFDPDELFRLDGEYSDKNR